MPENGPEVIGYADGEPIYGDPHGDDKRDLEARDGELDAPGYVYFIQGSHGGPVKIGYSITPTCRLSEFQTASPFRLVVRGRLRGTRQLEKAIQARFEDQRLRGEWFDPCDEMRMLAPQVRLDVGTPELAPEKDNMSGTRAWRASKAARDRAQKCAERDRLYENYCATMKAHGPDKRWRTSA